MSKELRDGLLMDNSIFVIDEKKPGFPIQARIIQFIAILLGSWGSIGVLLESVDVPADTFDVFSAMLLCAILVYGLCLFPSYDLVKLFFGLLSYGLILYSRLHMLQNGFYILENRVVDRLAAYYDMTNFQYIADYTTAEKDATLLMIMIVIPMVTLFTFAIVRSRLVGIAGILLFLPITISFLFGLIPSERYLITYIAAVLYLSQSSNTSHNVTDKNQKILLHRINSKAAIWLCFLCLFLFSFLKLFITEKEYNGMAKINELKTEIQTSLFNFSIYDVTNFFGDFHLFHVDTVSGGLDGGKLGNVSEVKFDQSEQLVITAPLESISEGVYLKGYVGSDYTGHSWENHSEEAAQAYDSMIQNFQLDIFSPMNQYSQFLKNGGKEMASLLYKTATMDVKYGQANKKFIYLPTFSDLNLLRNVEYDQDLYALPIKKKKDYSVKYYYLNLNPGPEAFSQYNVTYGADYSNYQRQYRDFVYDYYTRLPADGLERLKKDFSVSNEDFRFQDDYWKVTYVISYLNRTTRYSLSPGKLPEGKDYVEYFLYENKQGYCAHYATAAVLMLRAMGVPARYVEGYAVGPSDVIRNTISSTRKDIPTNQVNDAEVDVTVSVKDYNAHAWVEVYTDDKGWIPVDPTPGSDMGDVGLGDRESLANKIPAPTQPPATPTPRVTTKPQEVTPVITQAPKTTPGNVGSKEQKHVNTIYLALFLVFAGIILLFIIYFILLKHRRINHTRNKNRKAILIFRNMEVILRSCNELGKKGTSLEDCEDYVLKNCLLFEPKEFKICMEIVKKARFSNERITKDELDKVAWMYKCLVIKVYDGLPFGTRIFLKFNRVT